jgi:hypothetical protein
MTGTSPGFLLTAPGTRGFLTVRSSEKRTDGRPPRGSATYGLIR